MKKELMKINPSRPIYRLHEERDHGPQVPPPPVFLPLLHRAFLLHRLLLFNGLFPSIAVSSAIICHRPLLLHRYLYPPPPYPPVALLLHRPPLLTSHPPSIGIFINLLHRS
ncbi:hypothetical protein BJ508DRAFT_335740 [Ascobolus immersus RN42]|uniref:Uncharacterized protein n=1 Tax=Ascobolus immersus RN42 TaxID=1160509 RepID=A0A3N4HB86_ASCIM|nr:hypothetical protein BJ508DRAFT_335740 [Ascobolus immersus RN42]